MDKKSIGLVLGGGGGKGAYQIGAWQALREYGLDKKIGAVSGTSIGALNGALFVQGDYKAAVDIWESLDTKKVLVLDKKKHINLLKKFDLQGLMSEGVFSHEALLSILDKYADLDKISQSSIEFYATSCRLPDFKTTYFPINGAEPERIKKILMASAAIPMVFDMIKIDGKQYVDGGVVDNVPIKPLYEKGYRRFIVVRLDEFRKINRKNYKDADIIEVSPDQGWDDMIRGVLDFSPKGIGKRRKAGHSDMSMALSARYTLPLGQRIKRAVARLTGRK